MKYKLAIFDMDGTILDTLKDIEISLNHALSLHGHPTHSIDEVRTFVGNGMWNLITVASPLGLDKDDLKKIYVDFMNHYSIHCSDNTRPYDGIIDTIKAVRKMGIRTAVVSNKTDSAVQNLCIHHFDGLFDVAVGERTDIQKKPAPDMVNLVLDNLDYNCKEAVYIGDSEVDLATAANSNMDCIAVCWGFRSKELLKEKGATTIIDTPSEILELLK